MKYLFILSMIIGLQTSLLAQKVDRSKDIFIDAEGKSISQQKFREQWRNCARWDSINSTNTRVNTLNKNLFQGFVSDPGTIATELSKTTGKSIKASSPILLVFKFKGDLCTSSHPDENWSKSRIRRRKKFLKPFWEQLEKDSDLNIIYLFEKGIDLENDTDDTEEKFYIDQENYFRNNIFTQPTLCNSFAAIKPNGQILVRNGESRIDFFAKFLMDENWSQFFPEDQRN
tara:strand:- start:375 stop:1061 length:687 start_codon:yes stop_codon:yes gene_type:complete